MPIYRHDRDVTAHTLEEALADRKATAVIDPASGRWLIETKAALRTARGRKKVPPKELRDVKAEIEALTRPSGRPIRKAAPVGVLGSWSPHGTTEREVSVGHAPLAPGVLALRLHFGAGQATRMRVGREIDPIKTDSRLRMVVQPLTDDDSPVTIAVILTTDRQRPRHELGRQEVSARTWTTLQLDVPAAKRCDRLILEVVSDAEGALHVRDMALRAK